jgi:DNA-binding LacI/PurR family transcriptional regulator
MNDVQVTSKLDQMVVILKDAIAGGRYDAKGGRVESEHELSARHGISRNTVREAISALVQQGYLQRFQGKGTFVVSRRPPLAVAADTYAVFTRAHQHVFETETRTLVQAFQRRHALPIVVDVDEIQPRSRVSDILAKLLDQGVAGLVLGDGVGEALLDLCQRTGRPLPRLAVINRPPRVPLPAFNVVTDFTHGTRLATEHLLRLGHRRILFVIHRNTYLAAGKRPDADTGEYGAISRGYTGALAEAGLAAEERFFFIRHELA